MATVIRQSSSITVVIGPFVDSTDGVTAETALTISQADIRLSKNGGTFAQKNGAAAATHMENGFYSFTLDATDTNTVGRLMVAVSESGALPFWKEFQIVEEANYDVLWGADTLTAEIADAVWDEAQADHVAAGSFGVMASEVADILVDTAEIGADGAGLSAIPWNAAWDAEVQSEVNDALVALGLDHLLSASVAGADVADNSVFARLVSASATADWDDYVQTTDSLQAIRDRGDAAWTTGAAAPSAAAIADAVWDEAQGDHTTAGSFGLIASEIADILVDTGTTLPATLATIDGNVDAILLDTAEIGAAGAGLTAVPYNSAWDAEIQSEVNDALVALGLDHLVSASVVGADVADNSIFARLVSASATADWDDYVQTTDSLQAIRDRGDAAWTTGAGGTPPQLLQSTTIATLVSQTVFTLTAGSADDDAYNGAIVVVTDQTTSTQKAVGTVSDYVGTTRTVTLDADPGIFTMAVGDTIEIIAALGSSSGGSGPSASAIADAVWDEAVSGHAVAGSFGELVSDIDTTADAILIDTAEIGAAGAGLTEAGGTGDHLTAQPWNSAWDAEVQSEVEDGLTAFGAATASALATVDANVDAILVDTGTTLPATLTTIEGKIDTIDGIVDAILVDTDSTLPGLIATVDGNVDAILVDTDTTIPALIAALNDPTAAAIADAVWDETMADHLTAGSTGATLNSATTGGVDIAALVDAVWDEATADHQTAGSTGAAVSSGGSGSSGVSSRGGGYHVLMSKMEDIEKLISGRDQGSVEDWLMKVQERTQEALGPRKPAVITETIRTQKTPEPIVRSVVETVAKPALPPPPNPKPAPEPVKKADDSGMSRAERFALNLMKTRKAG
jgi:hypothetical protein